MRTIAWYESVVRETWADTPGRLDRRFRSVGEGRKRLWERYRNGAPTPSIERKGKPGIVATVGTLRPATRAVFEHPLWSALEPDRHLDVAATNAEMFKLHKWVWVPFFYVDPSIRDGSIRDWEYLEDEDEEWECPYGEYNLVLDMLTFYLLLFREAKSQERWRTATRAGLRLRALLQDWGSNNHLLVRINGALTRFVIDQFLGADYEQASEDVTHCYRWPEEALRCSGDAAGRL